MRSPSSRTLMNVSVGCLIGVIAGCAAATTLADEVSWVGAERAATPSEAAGTYVLQEFNGQPLPAPADVATLPPGACSSGRPIAAEALSGTVVIAPDGSATIEARTRLTCEDAGNRLMREVPQRLEGRAAFRGDRARINVADSGVSITFSYSADGSLAQHTNAGTHTWRRASSPESSPPAHVEEQEPSADTGLPPLVGLPSEFRTRIAASFPGWRLSTEDEVLRRSSELNGLRGMQLWDQRLVERGGVWWAWEGDFTGDGQSDIVTILTSKEDPLQDRLVALHGDGSHADLDTLHGWGVAVLRQGEEWRGTVLERDALQITLWEKDTWARMWNPSTRTYEGVRGTAEEHDCC
jgi:hypothetical protein